MPCPATACTPTLRCCTAAVGLIRSLHLHARPAAPPLRGRRRPHPRPHRAPNSHRCAAFHARLACAGQAGQAGQWEDRGSRARRAGMHKWPRARRGLGRLAPCSRRGRRRRLPPRRERQGRQVRKGVGDREGRRGAGGRCGHICDRGRGAVGLGQRGRRRRRGEVPGCRSLLCAERPLQLPRPLKLCKGVVLCAWKPCGTARGCRGAQTSTKTPLQPGTPTPPTPPRRPCGCRAGAARAAVQASPLARPPSPDATTPCSQARRTRGLRRRGGYGLGGRRRDVDEAHVPLRGRDACGMRRSAAIAQVGFRRPLHRQEGGVERETQ